MSTIARASREKLLFFAGRRGKNFGRRLLAVTTFTEGHVQFVDLAVHNDRRALAIAGSLVTVISASAERNDVVKVICTDNAANEVLMLNKLPMFSLQRQARLPII
jgi:hypothetical protein